MTIKPVETVVAPKYPDKYNDNMRRVLMSAKPNRWLGTPLAAGMLAATVALGLGGCVAGDVYTGNKAGNTITTQTTPSTSGTPDILEHIIMGEVAMPAPKMPYASLIPLFEYGDGTGAIGCVAVTSPVFFSEEEAFAVLSAAFAEAGLTLSLGGMQMENANIPVTDMFDFKNTHDKNATIQGKMKPDGTLEVYDLPVAFVSKQDIENWQKDHGSWVSVAVYNTKETAQILADNNPGLVVFYDPIAIFNYWDEIDIEKEDGESDEDFYARWDALEKAGRQKALLESERLLRMQAEAFIEWLYDVIDMTEENEPDDWAATEVASAIEAGLVPDSITNRKWQNPTSRIAAAEAMTLLIEKSTDKTVEQIAQERGWDLSTNHFSDTSKKEATFLKYAEVTLGVGNNMYAPTTDYTRAQIVTMLGRAAEAFFDIEARGANPFTDVPAWAAPYVGYAAEKGITQGIGDGKFDSEGVLQNQHTAVFMYRAFEAWK